VLKVINLIILCCKLYYLLIDLHYLKAFVKNGTSLPASVLGLLSHGKLWGIMVEKHRANKKNSTCGKKFCFKETEFCILVTNCKIK
jgi:hypothetical protein